LERWAASRLQQKWRKFYSAPITIQYVLLKSGNVDEYAIKIQQRWRAKKNRQKYLEFLHKTRATARIQRMARTHVFRKKLRQALASQGAKQARIRMAQELKRQHINAEIVQAWYRLILWSRSPAGRAHAQLEVDAKDELEWLRKRKVWRALWDQIHEEVAYRFRRILRVEKSFLASALGASDHATFTEPVLSVVLEGRAQVAASTEVCSNQV